MGLGRQWEERLRIWDEEFPKHLYEPVDSLEVEAFFTFEHLSLEQVKQQKFRAMLPGEHWGEKWEYGWFHTSCQLPPETSGERVFLRLGVGEEMLVYVNGQEAGSIDKKHVYVILTNHGKSQQTFDIYAEVYAGHGPRPENGGIYPPGRISVPEPEQDQLVIKPSDYGIWNQEIYESYLDYHTLYELLSCLPETSLRYMKIAEGLKEYTCRVDFELEGDALRKSIRDAKSVLAPFLACINGPTVPEYIVFGQSHLDLAWLWTTEETKRKAARTYSNQLALMDRYPDYKFLLCEPPILEYLKKYYPNLYQRVQEKVKTGQMIPDGGVWIESDTNLVCGESLVRQAVKGKLWFEKEMHTDSRLAWMPDTFGFSGALPQILAGCGITCFATQKLMRADPECDPFPFNLFWWEGIDGTRVLSHLYKKNNAQLNPSGLTERWEKDRIQTEGIEGMMFPFGFGDGGGGATETMLEEYERCKDLEGLPKCRMAEPMTYFDELDSKKVDKVYRGELYLAWHRGTYTAQAEVKHRMRKAEFALREAEYWTGILMLQMAREEMQVRVPADSATDQKSQVSDIIDQARVQLDLLWERLLFQQFHDILPGTGIHRVNEEARQELERVCEESRVLLQNILTEWYINIEREYHLPCQNNMRCLLNSYSWSRSQNRVNVPSCGFVIARAFKPAGAANQPEPSRDESEYLQYDSGIEQEKRVYLILSKNYQCKISSNGEILSLKTADGMELAARSLNHFAMYRDVNVDYDAWELGRMYSQCPEELEDEVQESEFLVAPSDQPGKASWCKLRIKRKIHKSILEQEILFSAETPRIEFHTKIDWQERHKLLKVQFPTSIYANEAREEIQFGYVRRPTHQSTQHARDQYEVCNQKYTVIEDGGHGLAVLNDGIPGVNVKDSCIGLSLLRAPVIPDMTADLGNHEMTYACYVYEGAFAQSDVVRQGYELNHAMEEFAVSDGKAVTWGCQCCDDVSEISCNDVILSDSYLQIDKKNIVIDSCKPAMYGRNSVVLRLYECMGMATQATITVPDGVRKVYQCSLLEREEQSQTLTLKFHPFEIKTLLLEV